MKNLDTDAMSNAIKKVVSLYGIEVLSDADRFQAGIKDFLSGHLLRAEREQLISSIKIGIGEELLKTVDKSVTEQERSLIAANALLVKNGFSKSESESVLGSFASALGWSNVSNGATTGTTLAKDDKKTVDWYTKAAERGDADAQCLLGLCYANGIEVLEDNVKAVFWYTKSAEQGHADAQYLLGVHYATNLKNYRKAVFWFTKSTEQGHVGAQYELGLCYANGKGVVQDYGKAVFWVTKSAEQGHFGAQCFLGLCYADGLGVLKDYKKAVFWFTKAAEQGRADAKNRLE